MENIERKIIVIIPVYNCKNFLREAVLSVLNQNYRRIEILLVDDGSTDGSSTLCDKLADDNSRIHVIHQKNSGVSSARNSGIEYVLSLCKENEDLVYIAFLDADDIWMPNFFDENIKNLMDKGYDLIGFQSCLCNCNLTRRSEPIFLKDGEYNGGNSSIWIHSTQHFGAMLYKTSFLNSYKIRFECLKYSEDKIFSMQCLYLADKIYLMNRLLYLYRQNSTSAMSRRTRGISYYSPIIAAYLQLDQDMSIWKDSVRGELHEGTILARIYLIDMIEEHFELGGNKKQLESFFKKHPRYYKILESKIGGKQVTDRWNNIVYHPFSCIFKIRIKSLLYKVFRVCYHISVVQKHIEKVRYPVKL